VPLHLGPDRVTRETIAVFAVFGVGGQIAVAGLGVSAALRGLGLTRALDVVRSGLGGYELWLGFVVAALATGGSLFFSEIAHFVPCELCWYERICMYPLAVVMLLLAVANDYRPLRYLWPLPLAGAGVSLYHLLVERGVVAQPRACALSAPGGCATRWIDEFGYVTIPVLSLTAFALLLGLFWLAGADE